MSSVKVSVIMPTHNRVAFLRRAVASVQAQSETDLELIVIDDASSDDTPAMLAKLATNDPRVQVLRNEKPLGGAGARNVGIAAARGEWLAFLDDDDEWLPQKLERQLAQLARQPAAVACSCSFEQHFSSGKTRVFKIAENVTLQQLLYDNVLGGASVCVCSRAVLQSIGGFDAKLRSGQDYDLWLRLRREGEIAVCTEPLVKYREHDGDRITNRVSSLYLGARRLHCKYRKQMDPVARRRRISFVLFVMSIQTHRSISRRFKYLMLSLRCAPVRVALWSFVNSAPMLVQDMFRRRAHARA